MARVTVEDCVDKVPNRFELVLLSAHRAREIAAGSPVTIDRDNDKNPVVALREIATHSPWSAFWLLVVAGFLPVPLKIFTWASGIVGVPLLPFIASMIVGRGKRVYLLAGVIRMAGPKAEAALHRSIEWIGWAMLVAIAVMIIYFKFIR